ncbi:MAG: SRPBCC family protein [Gammaproteobacteria bacterium]
MKRFLILIVLASASWAQETPSFVNEGLVNAPVEEVWEIWTTGDGYKALGPALADVDLRVGGLIRSRYRPDGTLGDAETIENLIMAYEPPLMLAIRINKPPASFPFKDAWKTVWTVVTLTEAGDDQTLVRVASMGYGNDAESLAMRSFFENGNQLTIEQLQKHFEAGAP